MTLFKRIVVVVAAAIASVALVAGPAAGAQGPGNPHFIGNQTSVTVDSDFNLVAEFKEAGLSSGSIVTIALSADLEATYQCINGGGNNPSDPKKTTISTTVEAQGTFPVGKNGQLSGSLELAPPAASAVLSCPGGQTATLTAGTWSDVRLDDMTSGAGFSFGNAAFSFGSPV